MRILTLERMTAPLAVCRLPPTQAVPSWAIGGEWFSVTTVVEDPTYLANRFVTSSHFRREPDNSKWNPRACRS